MKSVQKESSIVYSYVEKINKDYLMAPTTIIVVILVISLVVLKKFIYISDDKRDNR